MNLHEIELTKYLKKGYVHWRGVFEEHGWYFLGSGIEATVGRHPSKPYAVKVFSRDTPYSDFVALVQKHQNNPHFPRFSRYVRPVPGTEFSYVRMEILRDIAPEKVTEPPYLSQMAYLYLAATKLGFEFHHAWSDIIGVHLRKLVSGSLFDPEIEKELWQKIGSPDTSWKEAIDLVLTRYTEGTKWPSRLDMHPGNFMLRGSTLVITDPFVTRF